jgi:HEPN domain-containing protein
MSLHRKFFEAAQLDLETAIILTDRNKDPPAIYHLQQAYEKYIKSYFIFKEIRINKTPEPTVYDSVRKRLGHGIEESTIELLKDIGNFQKRECENKLARTADHNEAQILQNVISAINGYSATLDKLIQRLSLQANYVNNVKNYGQYVRARYEEYQKSISTVVSSHDFRFFNILLCMACLYPCLYRMESITRYPLTGVFI